MTELKQTITRWQGVGLVATTFLGTGVFILPQLTIVSAGGWAVWTWGLLVLAFLPLAWVFAELGKRFSHAGGPAFFVQEAFGIRYGHMIGLMFLCAVPLGAPAALMMTMEFLKPLVSLTAFQLMAIQLATLVALLALNTRGMELSGKMQLGLTVLIVGVVALMLVAFMTSDVVPAHNIVTGNTQGVTAAISLAIWSFLGIEAVTHLSAEFRDVKKDFVPAVLLGTMVVGMVYMLCTHLSMLSPNIASGEHLAMVDAFQLLLGETAGNSGRWVIAILGIVSGLATVNVYYASVSRLAWVLSKDGVLPASLKSLNQYRVPTNALMAVLCVSAMIIVAAYLTALPFEQMVRWVNGVFVVIYTASMLAAWRLLESRYRPAIIAGLVVCLVFAVCLGASMAYAVLLAGVFYIWLHVAR
ncbi:MAG: L-methionine/branched-chain amino acid transporter [Proteobacteria bacterium]|nr:MAG: L-methionine/branched-chain amino acid transporter [Pseudomonadota bacterium]